MQVKGRSTDDLEHLRCCGLLLQRFTQLVEQPRVLDGDDGLRGEVFDQFNLLIGEWPHFLAVNADRADQLVFLEHRNGNVRTSAAKIGRTRTNKLNCKGNCVDQLFSAQATIQSHRRYE